MKSQTSSYGAAFPRASMNRVARNAWPVRRFGYPCVRRTRSPVRLVPAAIFASVWALGGCGTAVHQTPPPQPHDHRTIAEGYSLLYGITSQQKDVDKLLIIKSVSEPVHALISEVAAYAATVSKELEDIAVRYPALRVDSQFLPEVEAKARAAIASDSTKEFLSTSGKDFERRLLHSQLDALQQESHIAGVMIGMETSDTRRAFWTHTHEHLDGLHTKVERLLERNCSCS